VQDTRQLGESTNEGYGVRDWAGEVKVMDSMNRLLWGALGLVGCLAVFDLVLPSLETAKGGTGGKGARADANLERRWAVVPQRTAAKCRVARQLRAEQIGLWEAAAWFRYLNETPSDCPVESIEGWPGAGPEENLCRQVIEYVAARAGPVGMESRTDPLVKELERQLADALAQPGGLVLPAF
jgi:hypothetical protein